MEVHVNMYNNIYLIIAKMGCDSGSSQSVENITEDPKGSGAQGSANT